MNIDRTIEKYLEFVIQISHTQKPIDFAKKKCQSLEDLSKDIPMNNWHKMKDEEKRLMIAHVMELFEKLNKLQIEQKIRIVQLEEEKAAHLELIEILIKEKTEITFQKDCLESLFFLSMEG